MAPQQGSFYDYEVSFQTAYLEKEYENTLGHTVHLLDCEKIRIQCMEKLFLMFENDGLQSQLDQANELIKTAAASDAWNQLHESRKEIKALQAIVQASSHEIEGLQKELASLRGNYSLEHNKLFEEKARLAKDLSTAQEELEKLKMHSASRTALLVGQEDLEKRLKSAETQLEHEKNAHERAQTKISRQAEEITTLSGQLEKTREELVEESRTRERQQQSMDHKRLDWETERARFEAKLESLEKKLRSTEDRLQESRDEFQRHRGHKRKDEGSDPAAWTHKIPLQGAAAHHFNPDLTIATPGAVQVREKTKRSSALPGDKSNFSITPFLNRTNQNLDSPMTSADEMDELDTVILNDKIGTPSTSVGTFEAKNKERRLDKILAVQGPPRDRGQRFPDSHRKVSPEVSVKGVSSKLSRNIDNEQQLTGPNTLHNKFSSQLAAKPKRRRLGAQRDKNIFDDDDDDLSEPRQPVRKLAIHGGLPSSTSAGDRLRQNRGFDISVGFSPLKRDKRRS